MIDRCPRYPVCCRDDYRLGERFIIDMLLHPRRCVKCRPQRCPRGRSHNIYDIDIVRNPFGRAFR